MKIGIDIRTLLEANYSGVSLYTEYLLKAIFKLNEESSFPHEFYLYYNSGRDLSYRLPVFNSRNVRIVETRYPNRLFNIGAQKILRQPKIDRLLGVDLLWLPNVNFIAWSQAARRVITIHDLSFRRYQEFYSWRSRLWHALINTEKLLRSSTAIVAVSENTKNDILELYNIESSKVRVIHSGIGAEESLTSDPNLLSAVRLKYGLPAKYILYLGNLEPRKNLVSLIAAYNALIKNNPDLKNYHLVLAGADSGRKFGQSREIFSLARQTENIKFLGYIPENDKAALYRLAALFVYPSIYEGFGFPPLEAMSFGAPVVAARAASLPEILGTAALLVDPFNLAELEFALAAVIKDEKLRSRLIVKGKARARQFSWERSAIGYLELFTSLN